MNKNSWFIFGAICVAIIGGLIFMSRSNKIDVSGIDQTKIHHSDELSGGLADHVTGNAKSKVILIEYGDFQCPGCGSAFPIMQQIAEKYKDQIAFVFRNYPLSAIHPNALAAASAAEAAGILGKYWEMHDKLYQNQDSWSNLAPSERTDYFTGLAREIGLDVNKFQETIESDQVRKKIAFDQALGNKADVQGTPTFYVNGDKVSDWRYNSKIERSEDTKDPYIWNSVEAFSKLAIDPALKANNIALPAVDSETTK